MSDGPAYSLWLVPEPEAREALTEVVARLAPRFATRAFAPHVTVQGDLPLRLKDVVERSAALAATMVAPVMRVRGIETSEHYFRTFFLALEWPGFDALLARSAESFGTRDGLSPFAHLSLAYGTMDDEAKAALAREFAARMPREVVFDRLAVTLSGKSVNIASWREVQAFALAASTPSPLEESTTP